jgi:hypothetical protein
MLLADLSELVELGAAALPPEIDAFRAWVAAEIGRQLAGAEPIVCPLPD